MHIHTCVHTPYGHVCVCTPTLLSAWAIELHVTSETPVTMSTLSIEIDY